MHVERRHTEDELKRIIKKEKSARIATRLRIVLLAMRGRIFEQIADDLSVAPRTVQQWVARYNAEGVEGLADKPRSGQPKKLTPEQEAMVVKWLREAPDLERDKAVAWRGPIINKRIETFFGKKFASSGLYALLHRLGYEPLRPRPLHRKADAAKQEEFKKSAPLLRARSGARTRG